MVEGLVVEFEWWYQSSSVRFHQRLYEWGGLLLDCWVDGFGFGWNGWTLTTLKANNDNFFDSSSSGGASFFVLVEQGQDDGLVTLFLVAGLVALLVRQVDDSFYWDGKGLIEMSELGI